MPTRYCGPGGNDGNSGLTWVLRKLTLTGVEDTPVVAGDVCYIGPGVYRETLTIDVSGAGGTEIAYIGDVTGEHTDGVGGIVRITGSDNDQVSARATCIIATSRDYRIFRGFYMDTASSRLIDLDECENWEIQDCTFENSENTLIYIEGTSMNNINIRRCVFFPAQSIKINFVEGAGVANAASTVENCMFIGGGYLYAVGLSEVGGVTIRNCFISTYYGIRVTVAPPGGYTTNTVENCIIMGCRYGLYATAVGEITEDFNNFCSVTVPRTQTNTGGNSVAFATLLQPPILHAGASQASGFKFPWWCGELSEWSPIRAITGSNEPTEELRGILRPVTASKNSWGPCQFMDMERETGTVHAGSASMVLHDAGRHQIWVPVANESTTISVYVYREANYAGNNPQMICKQPGQADDVTTDAAAASQWNLLTTTFTPAADPPYVVVELVSRNTNGANDRVFFDDLVVS